MGLGIVGPGTSGPGHEPGCRLWRIWITRRGQVASSALRVVRAELTKTHVQLEALPSCLLRRPTHPPRDELSANAFQAIDP